MSARQKKKFLKNQTRRRKNRHIYFNGTESQKADAFAHFTTFGYGLISMVVMCVGLLLGINIGGVLGFLVAICIIGWALWKFPNVMQSLDNIEKHDPKMKKYRIDKYK